MNGMKNLDWSGLRAWWSVMRPSNCRTFGKLFGVRQQHTLPSRTTRVRYWFARYKAVFSSADFFAIPKHRLRFTFLVALQQIDFFATLHLRNVVVMMTEMGPSGRAMKNNGAESNRLDGEP